VNLREAAGRLFVAGLETTTVTNTERAWLKLLRPSGVILFRRNIEAAEQSTALLREATKIVGRPLLRCVDLEGGLVDRLRDLIAPMPSPAQVFATGKPEWFHRHGRLIGQAAHATGFNAAFAPVLDLALPVSAEVMRTRVVSSDPADVVRYVSVFLEGLAQEQVLGCGKHFPGLGGGTLDSHHAMPVIRRSWKEMWEQDLVPYRQLAAALPMVMVAHAAYPRVTRNRVPASISEYWIRNILRQRIGYRGLVVSDDMEMGGILAHCPIDKAVVAAIAAGTDLIEICKDPALILTAYEGVLREAENSAAFARLIKAAARRVDQWSVRHELGHSGPIRAATPSQLQKLRDRILSFTEVCP
jgi:beta-N-acetylhexosaminidase